MTGTAKYLQISTSGKVRQNIEQAISKDSRKLIKLY